jgi:murein DD-endopeptidase MepM/ murein hydrolase activator NlpD
MHDGSVSLPAIGPGASGVDLSKVEGGLERLSALMHELDQAVVSLNLAHMARPGREPVRDRPVVSSFGNRLDPFTRKRAFHSGIDYPAPTGTPIYASAGGRVIFAGYRPQYGRTVEIDHGGGLVTRYAHASAILVKVGQVVMPEQQIARVGSTGRSTGPHLHFEILRGGRFVDPKVYIAQFREI